MNSVAGMAMAIDGVRRLSFPDTSIAGRALNLSRLSVGVQALYHPRCEAV